MPACELLKGLPLLLQICLVLTEYKRPRSRAYAGPSMMPGGDKEAYKSLEPIVSKVAAQVSERLHVWSTPAVCCGMALPSNLKTSVGDLILNAYSDAGCIFTTSVSCGRYLTATCSFHLAARKQSMPKAGLNLPAAWCTCPVGCDSTAIRQSPSASC